MMCVVLFYFARECCPTEPFFSKLSQYTITEATVLPVDAEDLTADI